MSTRQYIGARYVPKIYDFNGSSDWKSGTEYEALTIVTRNGNSYTSKKPVPANVTEPENNPDYWVATGLYNEQVESYRQITMDVADRIDEITADGAIGTDNLADNSVTADKLNESLRLETIKDYITPEMFGAVMDGLTDDSEAFQTCVNYSATNKIPVVLTKDIYVNRNITIPSYTRITGLLNYDYYPTIICGEQCTVALNCTGVNNIFENFNIKNKAGYRNNTAIVFNGGVGNNIDSDVVKVIISNFGKGVVVKGRNVKISGCLFSYCKYGVYYDLPLDGNDYRGLQVEDCRFHSIGKLSELPSYFYESSGIYIDTEKDVDLTVRNCLCDQGGTFITGKFNNGLIENNYIVCYEVPAIVLFGDGIPYNIGNILITGNLIHGKRGEIATGVTADRPDYLIDVNHSGRLSITNNIFKNCNKEVINIINSTWVNIESNVGHNFGLDNSTTAFVLIDGNNYISFDNNMSFDNSRYLYKPSTNSSNIFCKNNPGFNVPATNNLLNILETTKWVDIGTCLLNGNIDFELPNEFMVRMTDGETAFYVHNYSGNISCGTYVLRNSSGATVRMLYFDYENGAFIPRVVEFTTSAWNTPTRLQGRVNFSVLSN